MLTAVYNSLFVSPSSLCGHTSVTDSGVLFDSRTRVMPEVRHNQTGCCSVTLFQLVFCVRRHAVQIAHEVTRLTQLIVDTTIKDGCHVDFLVQIVARQHTDGSRCAESCRFGAQVNHFTSFGITVQVFTRRTRTDKTSSCVDATI